MDKKDLYNILLVDEDQNLLSKWERILQGPNRRILKAAHGYQAMRILFKEKVNLVITDVGIPIINGPELNGFDLIKRLKKHKRTKNIDVIFTVSEQETVDEIVSGLQDGAIDFLVKPLQPEITKAKVSVFERLHNKKVELYIASQKIEELLLNVLPKEVVQELKKKDQQSIVESYSSVSILFADFQKFTRIAEKLHPTELVSKLHFFFSEFDFIIEQNGLEKIKTIGDAYMCAGGLPVRKDGHAARMIKAGKEMLSFLEIENAKMIKRGELPWEIRIGIHTGPVVAGIVGTKKWQYDIWGDAVNIASRMQEMGEVGRINITGDTHELIRDQYTCDYRGKIKAKNKGLIDMYYVQL